MPSATNSRARSGAGLISRRADPSPLRPAPARNGPDYWPTPPCLLAALTSHLLPSIPPGRIWEPACGDGRLAEAMRAAGRNVVATDAYRIPALNFLHDAPPDPKLVALVTNAPFNRLNEFITRALQHHDSGMVQDAVLLLRGDHPMAQKRAPLLRRAHSLWYCCWRPRWIEHSTTPPRWSFIWAHWKREYKGPPRAYWLTSKMVRR